MLRDLSTVGSLALCALWCGWVGATLVSGTPQSGEPRSPLQAVPAAADIPLAVGEAGLPDIPTIDLRQQSMDEAVQAVLETPQAHRWMAVFSLGEQVGAHHGRDLAKARPFALALPDALQGTFYNGLAHTAPWDIEDVDAQVEAIEAGVPEAHRKGIWIGVLIRYATLHGDDPEGVVAFASSFAAAHGVDAVDGVRIGVQQRYRADPAKALTLLGRYPSEYQAAMAEEVGWRVGSELGLDPDKVVPLAKDLSAESRPRFFHGACRSAWNPSVSLGALRPLLGALAQTERTQCLTAVGFALAQVGRSSAQVAQAAGILGNAEWAATLVEVHGQFEGTEQGWLNPDLERPEPPPH